MKRIGKIAADAVFVLQVLIAFVLAFEDSIVLPAVLQSVGRMHPLFLHLPIGILLVTVLLLFLERYFTDASYHRLVSLLVLLSALTASLTTFVGLLLSLEGAFTGNDMAIHKWSGVVLSFLCWGLLVLRQNRRALKPAAIAAVMLLVVTGHYGARLTHGANFVLAPLAPADMAPVRDITDSSTVFEAGIQLIFDAKCAGCHNPDKAKGRLVLTSPEGVLKGGKTGALFVSADADNSLLMERLLLPIDHDDHMPPKDKAQLLPDEVALIRLWIDHGADMKTPLYALSDDDTLAKLTSAIIPRYYQNVVQQTYTFEFAGQEKIKQLNKPNRAVFQIASTEPAVQADFYLREHFAEKDIQDLLAIRTQLVSLNLAGMPVTDEALKTIARFENLEELNLNNTNITGDGLRHLNALRKLRSLSLTGTSVTPEAVAALAPMPGLREVFIWNTPIDQAEAGVLARKHPRIRWDRGFVPDRNERLKLNPPLTRNKGGVLGPDERIVLHHSLPGTIVRYTIDGSEPDSIASPLFQDGIPAAAYTLVKARAYREGWITSDVANFVFFRTGYRPDTAILRSTPDRKYPGEGAITLIDGLKGIPDFYRHPSWMAFREEDLIVDFEFKDVPSEVSSVTLSFAHHPPSRCFPPKEMELWGGQNEGSLTLLGKLSPESRPDPGRARIEGVNLAISPSRFPYYRLVARPVRKIPGDKSTSALWLMVDEVFFN